jgi:hypothetical protein
MLGVAVGIYACVAHLSPSHHETPTVASAERPVAGVTGVELATFGTLSITIGDREALRIDARPDVLAAIVTEVHGGTLRIRTRPSLTIRRPGPVHYYLMVKRLDAITASGSGDIEAPDLKTRKLELTVSGSGGLKTGAITAQVVQARLAGSGGLSLASVDAPTCEVRQSGSGDMHLGRLKATTLAIGKKGSGDVGISDGAVDEQDVRLNGSGGYEAGHLGSLRAKVEILGSGDVTVRVRDSLSASTTGSGSVHYHGNPTVERRVTGSGSVDRIGD